MLDCTPIQVAGRPGDLAPIDLWMIVQIHEDSRHRYVIAGCDFALDQMSGGVFRAPLRMRLQPIINFSPENVARKVLSIVIEQMKLRLKDVVYADRNKKNEQ